MSEPNHNQVTFLAKQLLLQMIRAGFAAGPETVEMAWKMAEAFYKRQAKKKTPAAH